MDMVDADERGSRAQLMLEGVSTPILTRVRELRPSGMTVEQSLPFLRLQTGVVDADHNRAHIESVSLVVADGVPRLVLDLTYDDAPARTPAHEHVPPLESQSQRSPLAGVARSRRRPDETLDYDLPPPEPDCAGAAMIAEPVADEAPREPTQVFVTHVAADHEPAHQLSTELSVDEQLILSAKPSYRLAQRWAKVKPHLQRAAVLARHHTVRFVRWAYPRLLILLGALLAATSNGFSKLRARMQHSKSAQSEG
jgi:hypothetical protein